MIADSSFTLIQPVWSRESNESGEAPVIYTDEKVTLIGNDVECSNVNNDEEVGTCTCMLLQNNMDWILWKDVMYEALQLVDFSSGKM